MCLNLSPMSPKPEDEDDLVECVHRYTAILMKMKLRKLMRMMKIKREFVYIKFGKFNNDEISLISCLMQFP